MKKNKIKEVKLNFKLNEATPNGRVYDKNNLLEKLSESIKHNCLMLENTDNYTSTSVDINKIIGFVDSYYVDKNNNIIFKIVPIDDNKILECVDECTISAIGKEKNKNIDIAKILCLRPTQDYVYKTNDEVIKEFIKYLSENREEEDDEYDL